MTDELIAADISDGGEKERDFSKFPACRVPEQYEGRQAVRQAMAERCITYGLRGTEIVVVDMTSADDKLREFIGIFPDLIGIATRDYVTPTPTIIEPSSNATKLLEEMDCAKTNGSETILSRAIVEQDPSLQSMPYVLVATDKPSCKKGVAGQADNINSITIYDFNDLSSKIFKSKVAAHEFAHLLGLGHDGNMMFPPKPGREKELYYSFDKTDTTEGYYDIEEIAKGGQYQEYDQTGRTVMGAARGDVFKPKLSPLQKHVLHRAEHDAQGIDDGYVRSIGKEEIEFKADNASDEIGIVDLGDTVHFTSDYGNKVGFDTFTIQAVTGNEPLGERKVEEVLVSFAHMSDATTMTLGLLDEQDTPTPNWTVKLHDDLYLKIRVGENGSMYAHTASSR